jgi:feruloyl esterase
VQDVSGEPGRRSASVVIRRRQVWALQAGLASALALLLASLALHPTRAAERSASAAGSGAGSAMAPSSSRPQSALEDEVAACAALADQPAADVHVRRAQFTSSGMAWAADAENPGRNPAATRHAFCRVQGVIEQEIAFELWLPLRSEWNGKFLGAGVGGAAGAFNYSDLPRGVDRGYASATTDTGHKAADAQWMLGDPARLKNYELRANHLLAERGKAIAAAYYGRGARHSYFIGCSGGGRQGLKEMQRFPDDYDGIISGANGPQTPEMTVRRMWELLQRDAHPGLMSPADWTLVADRGAQACDAQDGVTDGIAEDPRQCHFDIATLACPAGTQRIAGQCLSAEQVSFAQSFYAPLRDASGRALDEGILPGVLIDSGRSQLAIGTFGQAIRRLPDWDGKDFDAARDLAAIDRMMPELRADAPDVRDFRQRGGKLLMYTGWMDGAVAAKMVIAYRDALAATAGGERRADEFMRLYLLPGVQHCRGGPGADQIGGSGQDGTARDAQHDLLSALEEWVEKGRAPGSLVASKLDGTKTTRTHRVCPYPQQAVYDGRGNGDDARSYRCALSPAVRGRASR